MTDRHAAYPTGLKDTPTRHRALRQRMEAPGIVVAPGCYDCISARLVEVSGFAAAYITGSGVSMSALGAPDMGALSFGEILDRVWRICDAIDLRKQVRHGRVDRLYVIVQRKLVDNGKADEILRSFVDYPIEGWVKFPLGDFVCFYQVSS